MSDFFEWDPSRYSVHVPEMNAEHQQIITAMNKLHELHQAEVTGPELRKAVTTLGENAIWASGSAPFTPPGRPWA